MRAAWAERFTLIMVDEFQDTNRLQLELLESLDRDNLFAVGDEFQSIYRFRHADVSIFRERRERLGARRCGGSRTTSARARSCSTSSTAHSRPSWGSGSRRSPAGAVVPEGPLRLFDPDPVTGDPPVELLITDQRGWDDELEREVGLAGFATQPWRRAEARLIAHRLRTEVDDGRRPGDIVVLVRATGSLRLLEQALEEQGLPTYVVGGRGYWSQEQVRDGVSYLSALANPRAEESLLAALSSPFCGVGTDALVLARRRRTGTRWAMAGAARGRGRRVAGRAARGRARSVGRLLATSSRPSVRRRSGSRPRCCSSARSSRPATTWPCSPAPAATGGWRTCAS